MSNVFLGSQSNAFTDGRSDIFVNRIKVKNPLPGKIVCVDSQRNLGTRLIQESDCAFSIVNPDLFVTKELFDEDISRIDGQLEDLQEDVAQIDSNLETIQSEINQLEDVVQELKDDQESILSELNDIQDEQKVQNNDILDLETKTQNQSFASGVTSFSSNIRVAGSSMPNAQDVVNRQWCTNNMLVNFPEGGNVNTRVKLINIAGLVTAADVDGRLVDKKYVDDIQTYNLNRFDVIDSTLTNQGEDIQNLALKTTHINNNAGSVLISSSEPKFVNLPSVDNDKGYEDYMDNNLVTKAFVDEAIFNIIPIDVSHFIRDDEKNEQELIGDLKVPNIKVENNVITSDGDNVSINDVKIFGPGTSQTYCFKITDDGPFTTNLFEDDRIRIFFDGHPDSQQIAYFKKTAFTNHMMNFRWTSDSSGVGTGYQAFARFTNTDGNVLLYLNNTSSPSVGYRLRDTALIFQTILDCEDMCFDITLYRLNGVGGTVGLVYCKMIINRY